MGLGKFLWSITPIGAVMNLARIDKEHRNREVRRVAIGWNPDYGTDCSDYKEDTSVPANRPAEYVRVVRSSRPVKESIKAKLPKLVKVYED